MPFFYSLFLLDSLKTDNKKSRQWRDFKQAESKRLLLDQEIVERFTLLIHCFLITAGVRPRQSRFWFRRSRQRSYI